MKVSVSLPDEDVQFLDEYAAAHGIGSRSAAVQKAIRLLRASRLGAAYEDAWPDWETNDESEVWDSALADGLG